MMDGSESESGGRDMNLGMIHDSIDAGNSFQEGVVRESRRKAAALERIKITGTKRSLSSVVHEVMDIRKQLFSGIPDTYKEVTTFQRVIITESEDIGDVDPDQREAGMKFKTCMALREKWLQVHPSPPQDDQETFSADDFMPTSANPNKPDEFRRRPVPRYDVFSRPVPTFAQLPRLSYQLVDGVMCITEESPPDDHSNGKSTRSEVPSEKANANLYPVPTFSEFVSDYNYLRYAVYSGPAATYAHKHLELLAAKFHLHVLLNEGREFEAQKSVPHRDFYNVRKVDTHIHHSACMNQKHLLQFIKRKLKNNPDEIVYKERHTDKLKTLGEVFTSLDLTAYSLSIDTLDMHAAHDTFHRFDRFNLKYNPAGQSELREIFLKTDNFLDGRYLAELTQEVMDDLKAGKYQLAEWRISIYGRSKSEWNKLAKWFYDNKLSHNNVRWMVQIPRLYQNYRESNNIKSFAEMLDNIFGPLFEVSVDPSSNPALHYFLEALVAFDSVDDESRPERAHLSAGAGGLPQPEEWTSTENPPYGYWMYYTYANLCALNKLRASRGLRTFQFRPHCGESGDVDHLVAAYLVADQINHGILLRKNPAIQYLYYLSQVGIAMSPLSNNMLFLDYNRNPFPKYFSQGMNVSLSTDDPLILHYTKDALLEEYSVATQVWKLTSVDQCEIARNSVLQSGWEKKYKRFWLGENYQDIKETNVPHIRLQYRKECLRAEINALDPATIHTASSSAQSSRTCTINAAAAAVKEASQPEVIEKNDKVAAIIAAGLDDSTRVLQTDSPLS